MSTLRTIKELKEAISNLPDDMEIGGYNGGNGDLHLVTYWLITEDKLSEKEKKDGYPNGVTPTLVISVDD